jgi:hypothetical protein
VSLLVRRRARGVLPPTGTVGREGVHLECSVTRGGAEVPVLRSSTQPSNRSPAPRPHRPSMMCWPRSRRRGQARGRDRRLHQGWWLPRDLRPLAAPLDGSGSASVRHRRVGGPLETRTTRSIRRSNTRQGGGRAGRSRVCRRSLSSPHCRAHGGGDRALGLARRHPVRHDPLGLRPARTGRLGPAPGHVPRRRRLRGRALPRVHPGTTRGQLRRRDRRRPRRHPVRALPRRLRHGHRGTV